MGKLQPGDPDDAGAEAGAAGTGDSAPGRPLPGYSYCTPEPAPERPDRSSRWTIALIVVALIVALGAGGSVYAVMNKDGEPKTPVPHATTGSRAPGGDGSSRSHAASRGRQRSRLCCRTAPWATSATPDGPEAARSTARYAATRWRS
ncbi:hypothetical protein [Streptomyces sp. NBC_00859]|uniref:hypothetical protein n=1 Tax=Streptomyces sp. NBC_00859 TaxID=2903682 RepID=UPI00386D32EA|nr:hypothetical protein OG584_15625 [Streptomyces sp. NBC_00859]